MAGCSSNCGRAAVSTPRAGGQLLREDRSAVILAPGAARWEDRDEMVAVRLAELEDRSHRRSGPDEIRRLRRESLQAGEHVVGGFHDGDTWTLCVVVCPLVLEQAAHEEHVAAMPEGEAGLHA
jgi:hypothetical protein